MIGFPATEVYQIPETISEFSHKQQQQQTTITRVLIAHTLLEQVTATSLAAIYLESLACGEKRV